MLSPDQVLTHYNSCLPIILSCDTSNKGVGAVLTHRFPNNVEKPFSYASYSLSVSEKNYSSIHKKYLLSFGRLLSFTNIYMVDILLLSLITSRYCHCSVMKKLFQRWRQVVFSGGLFFVSIRL